MTALLPLLLSGPALALDLTLAFEGEQTTSATLHQVNAEQPPLAALVDPLGDEWVVMVDDVEEELDGAWRIKGLARLLEVEDPSLEQPFLARLRPGEPGTVELLDPAGEPRTLRLLVEEPAQDRVVDCTLLVAPTVIELADSLQQFLDEERQPVTGVGQFTIDEELVQAQYVCGW